MKAGILTIVALMLVSAATGCEQTSERNDARTADSSPAVAVVDAPGVVVEDSVVKAAQKYHAEDFPAGYVHYDTMDLRSSTARLFIATERFDSTKHHLERCAESFDDGDAYSYLCRIDGREYFGSDRGIPLTTLLSLAIEIDGRIHQLDVSQMFNPWSGGIAPRRWDFELTPDSTDGSWYLDGNFSDAAGSYDATWKVDRNGARRTHLEHAEC